MVLYRKDITFVRYLLYSPRTALIFCLYGMIGIGIFFPIIFPADAAPGMGGEILIQYNTGSADKSPESIGLRQVNEILGAKVTKNYGPQGLPGMYRIAIPDNISQEAALAYYRQNPQIRYAEPNYRLTLESVPDDPYFFNQWGLLNTVTGADIDAKEGWDLVNVTAPGVIIAVIDTGIDYSHPDLAGSIWKNPGEIPGNGIDDDGNGFIDDIHGWDFADHDSDPADDIPEEYGGGHGTMCSGIIGATGNNAMGISGVGWNATLMAVKAFNASGGYYDDAIASVKYASDNNASIVSFAWRLPPDARADILKNVINNSPALFVCSAGNEGEDTDIIPHYPSGFDCENIISVAATDPSDALAVFGKDSGSNYGRQTVDLGAPGLGIFTTSPGGEYIYADGTSVASPFVAAIAALVKTACPDCSQSTVKAFVLKGADTVPSLFNKTRTSGRANLHRSIQLAQGQAKGRLEVWSVPTGARITIDGLERPEITNTSIIEILSGNHQVAIYHEGYQVFAQEIFLPPWETVRTGAKLRPIEQKTRVRVTSYPQGATIFVDGNNMSLVTNATLELPAGVHNIGAWLHGRFGENTTVNLTPAVETEVFFVISEPVPPEYHQADFSASPVIGAAPLSVSFVDLSSGKPEGHHWSFGDGTVSDGQNPVHVYMVQGSYTVSLATKNQEGSSILERPGYIQVL